MDVVNRNMEMHISMLYNCTLHMQAVLENCSGRATLINGRGGGRGMQAETINIQYVRSWLNYKLHYDVVCQIDKGNVLI